MTVVELGAGVDGAAYSRIRSKDIFYGNSDVAVTNIFEFTEFGRTNSVDFNTSRLFVGMVSTNEANNYVLSTQVDGLWIGLQVNEETGGIATPGGSFDGDWNGKGGLFYVNGTVVTVLGQWIWDQSLVAWDDLSTFRSDRIRQELLHDLALTLISDATGYSLAFATTGAGTLPPDISGTWAAAGVENDLSVVETAAFIQGNLCSVVLDSVGVTGDGEAALPPPAPVVAPIDDDFDDGDLTTNINGDGSGWSVQLGSATATEITNGVTVVELGNGLSGASTARIRSNENFDGNSEDVLTSVFEMTDFGRTNSIDGETTRLFVGMIQESESSVSVLQFTVDGLWVGLQVREDAAGLAAASGSFDADWNGKGGLFYVDGSVVTVLGQWTWDQSLVDWDDQSTFRSDRIRQKLLDDLTLTLTSDADGFSLAFATTGTGTLPTDISGTWAAAGVENDLSAVEAAAFLQGDRCRLVIDSVSVTVSKFYDSWIGGFGLEMDELGADADPDLDGYDNLQEYAFGGNPNDINDVGNPPSICIGEDSGTKYFIHTYAYRTEPSGLTYDFETSPNLIHMGWTNIYHTYLGEGAIDEDFNLISNGVPLDAQSEHFFQVIIGK
jgi:hypothetical protein